MSKTYKVNWYSNDTNGLNSAEIPGKDEIRVPQKTTDTTSTSLTLTGNGLPNYGEIQQENFVRLLENFAGGNVPQHGTIGQLWYNTDEKTLYIKVGPVHAIDPNGWEAMWQSGNKPFASLSQYNTLANTINRVIGAPTAWGTAVDMADNQYGWGQTDLVPVYANALSLAPGFSKSVYPNSYSNSSWAVLISRLRKALRHIGFPESATSPVGFKNDGTPPAGGLPLANNYNNYPAVGTMPNIEPFGGANPVPDDYTWQTYYDATISQVSTLDASRFKMAPISSEASQLYTYTKGSPWSSTIIHNLDVTFTSFTAAKTFFNSGGYLRFAWSLTPGGATAINQKWVTFLQSVTDIMFDYKGLRKGGGSYMTGVSGETGSRGFYDLDSNLRTIFRRNTGTGMYGGLYGGSYAYVSDSGIEIKANITTGQSGQCIVHFQVWFIEGYAAGEQVTGSTISSLWGHKPSSLNVNQQPIQQPTVAGSGTFQS